MTFNFKVPVQPHEDGHHCGACQWAPLSGGICRLFGAYHLNLVDISVDALYSHLKTATCGYDQSIDHIHGPGNRKLTPWTRCPACTTAEHNSKPCSVGLKAWEAVKASEV